LVLNFNISIHAQEEMRRRGISLAFLESVLQSPEQVILERGGKKVYQSRLHFGGGKTFLLRAIVNEEVDPPLVVTVYRTSKINKYWRTR